MQMYQSHWDQSNFTPHSATYILNDYFTIHIVIIKHNFIFTIQIDHSLIQINIFWIPDGATRNTTQHTQHLFCTLLECLHSYKFLKRIKIKLMCLLYVKKILFSFSIMPLDTVDR